ncbi:ABC transporter ATP-binding protein [Paenibacillus mesophilus]|uniref:ABC transporter ATP-binding protein n=1 Tax=Paenibacillus mesophilus TaxID=2582849 RepID=UPI00110E60FE|nr:ABC transporter ATP-binding protein [Paenibacillus mesophilus]TMV48159.1 ABC transporter ATP-binding protein [Paenibacillus mesophilus]
MTTVLKAQALSKLYGANNSKVTYRALDQFNLEVGLGEFVGVMGPSGSGKTTLLNLLSTIDRPTSGRIEVNGTDPSVLRNKELAMFRRRHLGFIFQDFNLLETLSIKENIVLPLVLDNVKVEEIESRLREIADVLGIAHIMDKRTYEVSGGQQQRAAIARAIIHRPAIVLADELTGNLDSKAAKDAMESLRKLNEERGTTILMVTHDPFAASYCRRIVFIKDGKLFSEIRRGTNRQAFFQQILDALSVLGGNFDDVSQARPE